MSDIEMAIGEDPEGDDEETGADDTSPSDEQVDDVEEQASPPQGNTLSRKGKIGLALAPPPPPAPTPTPAPRPRGRPKKDRTKENAKRVMASPNTPPASTAPNQTPKQIAARETLGVPPPPTEERTLELGNRWAAVLESLRYDGYGPEHVTIRIWRQQKGAFVGMGTEPQYCGSIDGGSVAGNELLSPADAVVDFLTQTVHVQYRGPARYNAVIDYKHKPPLRKSREICKAYIELADPLQLAAQARSAAEYARVHEPAISAQPAFPRQAGFGAPYPQAYPGAYPQMPPMASFTPADPMAEVRAELAALVGQKNLSEEVKAILAHHLAQTAQAPQMPPPAPVVVQQAAPRLSAEEQAWLEEGRFRAMASRLGFVSKEEFDRSVAAARPVAGVAALPAATQQGAIDPFAGFTALLKGFKQMETLKTEAAEALGLAAAAGGEEEDEDKPVKKPDEENPLGFQAIPGAVFGGGPVMFPTKAEGWVETLQSFVMGNPAVAMEGVRHVSGFLTSDAFQRVLNRFAGGPPQVAQVAQQAVAAGLVGTGSHAQLSGAPPPGLAQSFPAAMAAPQPPPRPRGPAI